MTRLKTEWISQIEGSAALWDQKLKKDIGMGYLEIAAAVSDRSTGELKQRAKETKAAVVPVTCGEGVINTFSESVAAIVSVMGAETFVTENTDVNGIYEAAVMGADILYLADEDRYLALNIKSGQTGDNNIATAKGYVALLEQMAGGLQGKQAAVLGYGMVGRLMCASLKLKGAKPFVYDKSRFYQKDAEAMGYTWIADISQLKDFTLIADATSEGGWLSSRFLNDDVRIAAPGLPFSLDDEACGKLSGQYINDMLEIGTAAMFGLVL